MDRTPDSKGPLSAGLLCAGALLLARQALLTGDGGELAAWLLAESLPDRLIEALILGVAGGVLAYRAPGPTALVFNAVVFSWAVAGLPRPDVGPVWPLALALGLGLSGAALFLARQRPAFLDTTWGVMSSALLGVVGPALLVGLGGATAPTWEVDGQRVSPTLARPDAPALVLVILDGVGARRADPTSMPALAALARTGSRFTCAVAAAPTRAAALGSLLGPQSPGGRSLAQDLAREGFTTALFGPPGLPAARGYQKSDQTAASPDAAVERAAAWLRGVAGARFLLTVVIPSDVAGAEDLRDSSEDPAAAGLRATDRALGSLLAHLSALSIDGETVVAVVGTVEGQAPASMKQAHLHVPLLVAGPGLPAGRREGATVEAGAVGPSLGYLGGSDSGLDLLTKPGGVARFADRDGGRGLRQGEWSLWVTGEGRTRLFQVESDPEELSDMAAERPELVESLSGLLNP